MLSVEKTPVIICGAGSAGLCAATFLACAGIPAHKVRILERNAGPMRLGQADGVQCRTVEVFESFGLSEQLLRDAYHVLEVCFWTDKENNEGAARDKKLVRTRRTPDTMPGLSHHPHVILNQASINGMLLEKMNQKAGIEVEYGWHVTDVSVDHQGDSMYPCVVKARRGPEGEEIIMRAKYVLVSISGFYPACHLKREVHKTKEGYVLIID
jgi:phenol 2-monooxygenase (NADPH)